MGWRRRRIMGLVRGHPDLIADHVRSQPSGVVGERDIDGDTGSLAYGSANRGVVQQSELLDGRKDMPGHHGTPRYRGSCRIRRGLRLVPLRPGPTPSLYLVSLRYRQ